MNLVDPCTFRFKAGDTVILYAKVAYNQREAYELAITLHGYDTAFVDPREVVWALDTPCLAPGDQVTADDHQPLGEVLLVHGDFIVIQPFEPGPPFVRNLASIIPLRPAFESSNP
jgi:hypothetical protein